MILFALILVPLMAAAVAALMKAGAGLRTLLFIAAALHLGLTVAARLLMPVSALGGWLALDALGGIFLAITSVLFFLVSIYTTGYLRQTEHGNHRTFVCSMLVFLAAMTLVTISHHLGLLWVAVEATTLASAPLIYFHRSPRSLEAMWKYLLICSVGIGLALLGTFFLAFAGSSNSHQAISLELNQILKRAGTLHQGWLKSAFIFLLVGYGTKMGLVPLHTWLPDAHSEAPSPASALLSGALLNCAFLGILRFCQITFAAGITTFVQDLLVIFGLLSLGVAAAFIVGQADFKRMLAYSSVEHIGILALGIGLGGSGVYGSLLHAVNHSLTKCLLFLLAGNLLIYYGTKEVEKVRGLLKTYPMSGTLLLAGFLAIVGSPPFGLFLSEMTILKSALDAGQAWTAALYLLFLAVAFVGMAQAFLKMASGESAASGNVRPRESSALIVSPLILAACVLWLGMHIPDQLNDLLHQAAGILSGEAP